jgi:hypothetical protein
MYSTFVSNDVIPVTPSDAVQLTQNGVLTCKTAAGNVVVVTAKGNQRTYPISIDEKMPCIVNQVLATGTTATGLYLFPV